MRLLGLRSSCAFALLLELASATATAQPIESCSPVDFGPDFGAPENATAVLTEQLASCGLHFSTTDPAGVTWFGGGLHPASFDYCIAAGDIRNSPVPGFGVAPIRIDFDRPVSSVSIRGYDGGPDRDRLVVEAYGPGDALVDSDSLTDGFEFSGRVVTVSGDRIDYVTARVELSGAGLFLDDLTYEPATGDSDGDGIADGEDACVDSITSETLAIGECDTDISNDLLDEGCTMADAVGGCFEDSPSDRRLRRCVRLLAREWRQDRLINPREKKSILACANELGS